MKKYLLTATILSAAMPALGQTILRQTTLSPIITSSPTITNNIIREPSLNTSIITDPIQSSTDTNDSEPSGPSIPSTSWPSVDIGRLPDEDAPIFINPTTPSIGGNSEDDAVNDDRNWGDVLTFPEFDNGLPDFGEDAPDDGEDGEDTPNYGEDGEDTPNYGEDGEDRPDFGEDGEDRPDFGEDGEDRPDFGEDGEDRPDFGEDGEDRLDEPGGEEGSDDAPVELEPVRPSFNSVSCTDRVSYRDFLKDDDLEALLGSDWLRLEFNDCDGVYEFDRRRSPVYNIRYSNRVCGRASFSQSRDCYGWAQALIAGSKDAFYLAILRAGQARACHQSTDETGLAPWEVVSNQSKCLSFTRDGFIVESRSGDVVGVYSLEQ